MKTIKIAVIGLGNWGKNITRVCHELNILSRVCDNDTNQGKAQKFAEEFGVLASTWHEILSDENINAVAIALPANVHKKYVAEALLAKKHVFIEKPLAMDKRSAQELCILAQKANKVLMVGHILQYHSAYIKLKELINAGEIGDIKYIESTRLHIGPIRYDAGIIWELLPHDVSMLLGLSDKLISNIVVAQQQIYNNHPSHNYGDVINVSLKFADGTLARIYSSWLHPRKEQKFWVAGTKGMLVFEDTENWDNKLKLYKYNDTNSQSITSEQKIALTQLEPLKAEINEFVNSIKHDTLPITNGYEGVKVVSVLEDIESKLKADQQFFENIKEAL